MAGSLLHPVSSLRPNASEQLHEPGPTIQMARFAGIDRVRYVSVSPANAMAALCLFLGRGSETVERLHIDHNTVGARPDTRNRSLLLAFY